MTRQWQQQPSLYSWTVVTKAGDPPQLGALGVSDDRHMALSALSGALREAPPGSHGVVHRVTVSMARVGYWYDSAVVRVEFDPDDGKLLVHEPSVDGDREFVGHPIGDWLQDLHGEAR